MAGRTKTLSFPEEYESVYQHLMAQDNASKYVCRLVENDLSNTKSMPDIIRTILSEELQKISLHTTPDNNIVKDTSNLIEYACDLLDN